MGREWVSGREKRREKKWRRTRRRRRRPSDLKVRRKLFISHHASAPWTSTSDLSVPWKKNTPQNKNYHKVVIITGSILSSDWLIGQWLVFVATVKNSTVKSSCWTTRKSHWSQSKEWKLVWISVYSTGLVFCLTVGKSTVRYQMWTAGHVVMKHFKLQPSPVMICHLFSTKWDPKFNL